MRIAQSLFALTLLVMPHVAAADVIDRAPTGFTTRTVVTIAAAPDRVYQSLLGIADWWNPEHTYSGKSANLRLDAKPGGCFCETLPNGGGIEHAVVVYVDPGRVLRLRGALGPLQQLGVAGSLTWTLEAAGTGTTATVTYAVGGYAAGGLDGLATIVDEVIADQLRRLKSAIEQPRR